MRQHPAGARVERHQRALHRGSAAARLAGGTGARRRRLALRRVAADGGAGDRRRLDHHHVAGLHHVRHPPRRAPGLPSRTGRAQARSDSAAASAARAGRLRRPARASPPCASLSVTSSTTASRQSGSMPGGRGTASSAAGQFVSQVAGRHRRWVTGAAPAAHAAVVGHQPVAQRLLGGDLQHRIKAGAHHQAALVVVVRRRSGRSAGGAPPRRTSRRRGSAPAGGTPTGRSASALAAAACSAVMAWSSAMRSSTQSRRASRGIGEAERVVVVRRLRQRGQERRLGERQLVQRLVEIGLRRRRDAVGAEAEIDLVQVQLEDALLAQASARCASPGSPPCALRANDTSLSSSMFLATCWVMVEAPIGRRPCARMRQVGHRRRGRSPADRRRDGSRSSGPRRR